MTSLPAKLLIAPIRFYQRFITPYTPATCVYYPTCSAYAVTALRTHGAVVGTGLTIWRLLRCNPWSSGGVDHVPSKDQLWHRHPPAGPDVDQQDHSAAEQYSENQRERGEAAGSSSTVSSAVARSAGTDCDVPPSAARPPMIGRSAA
jgi:putative membrane protein insertion efficiency factor